MTRRRDEEQSTSRQALVRDGLVLPTPDRGWPTDDEWPCGHRTHGVRQEARDVFLLLAALGIAGAEWLDRQPL